VLRVGLGGVCLLAGIEKARAPQAFFDGVRRYDLVPAGAASAVGTAVIGAEVLVGALLVTHQAPVAAAAGAIVLFAAFAAALGVSLARSNRSPCHCFGASELETISPVALARALVLTALAVVLYMLALHGPGSISGDDTLPALLMAVALAAVTRLSGLLPLAWSFLRAPAVFYPTPTRRTSFRHQSLHVPLFPKDHQ
jgi:hypothetical protein